MTRIVNADPQPTFPTTESLFYGVPTYTAGLVGAQHDHIILQ